MVFVMMFWCIPDANFNPNLRASFSVLENWKSVKFRIVSVRLMCFHLLSSRRCEILIICLMVLAKTKTFFSPNTPMFIIFISFSFPFRYSIIVNVFDETGWTRTPASPHPSPLFPFHFFFFKTSPLRIFPSFSLKLFHLSQVKSLTKPETLDGT